MIGIHAATQSERGICRMPPLKIGVQIVEKVPRPFDCCLFIGAVSAQKAINRFTAEADRIYEKWKNGNKRAACCIFFFGREFQNLTRLWFVGGSSWRKSRHFSLTARQALEYYTCAKRFFLLKIIWNAFLLSIKVAILISLRRFMWSFGWFVVFGTQSADSRTIKTLSWQFV